MTYQINDILYTKDGRKSGNLTIVDVTQVQFWLDSDETTTRYTCMSDYGNRIETYLAKPAFHERFFTKPGKAKEGHKYYNYKQTHPEEFI